MVSAVLSPLQAGSWLMSILAAFGAAPSSFTVPLTLATVAGSIGVAAGEVAGVAAGCSVVASLFPPHPASASPNTSGALQIAVHRLVFISFPAPFIKI